MEAIKHLLESARQGEGKALSTLYHHFLPGIFGYIALRVPDRATAEDLTSEVFIQMLEGIYQLRATDEAGFAAWLLRIARMAVANYYRKRSKQPTLVPLPDEPWEEMQIASFIVSPQHGDDPVVWIETREEWQRVVDAINSLTEEQRLVLVGRLLLGYDVATVARMVGKKANAVKALQFRALKSLHRILGRQAVSPSTRQERRGETL